MQGFMMDARAISKNILQNSKPIPMMKFITAKNVILTSAKNVMKIMVMLIIIS